MKEKLVEFKVRGKLRGGTIIEETKTHYKVESHIPERIEFTLNKNEVKLLN